jgi:hypothetical protein
LRAIEPSEIALDSDASWLWQLFLNPRRPIFYFLCQDKLINSLLIICQKDGVDSISIGLCTSITYYLGLHEYHG